MIATVCRTQGFGLLPAQRLEELAAVAQKAMSGGHQDVLRDGDMLSLRPAEGRPRKAKQKALPAPPAPTPPALLALPAPAGMQLPEALESSWN